jgi:thymidylate synthase
MMGIDKRVSDIREMFRNITPDPVTGMREIVNASFIADEDIIFGTANPDYIQRELAWYLSQSLKVSDIPEPIPTIWQEVANSEGEINSNYGWCVFSKENGSQFENVKNTLLQDKHSRQGALIYNRPTMHVDSKRLGMKDFMCTYSQQFLIRDDKLVMLSYMRSNDAVFGYKNDVAWARYLQGEMLQALLPTYPTLEIGDLIWNAASLHVYPRHAYLLYTI